MGMHDFHNGAFFINYVKDNIVFPAWKVFNSDNETSEYYKIQNWKN